MAPPPQPLADTFAAALGRFNAGDLLSAQRICIELLSQNANDHRALFLLGLVHHRQGEHLRGVELIQRAITVEPSVAGYHANLSAVLAALGKNDEAIAAAQEALRLQPNYIDALVNLANAFLAKGAAEQAIEVYAQVLAGIPPNAPPGAQRAGMLARHNLARALHMRGRMDEAIALLSDLVRAVPSVAEFQVTLANALRDQARIVEAVEHYRVAARIAPDNPSVASALLFSLWFHPTLSQQLIFREHQSWNEKFALPLRDPRPHRIEPLEGRRIRVGYLSPDFRHHANGYLIEPVLANHDHGAFQIFCYSNATTPDSLTERIRAYADVWRETAALSDAALAEQIRADQIDVLVDLTSHMANNRALVFARKPAPVQVNYLAYPATSGQTAIDYRITCDLLDPGDDQFSSEGLIRIPDTFWCYGPSPDAPPVNDLPALSSDRFTFGSLNTPAKVNDAVVALWSQVLLAVPKSRLLMLMAGGAAGNRRAADRFERHGVARERIVLVDFQPRDRYLGLFHQVDVGLDPFPYNGHTTSLDSLYMGVPFVTLRGTTAISRAGECILTNVGLMEFVANDQEQYVELCAKYANDLPQLSALRRQLRDQMMASALGDAKRFTRNIENAFRQMLEHRGVA
ncbi:MAG TPA: tetratricopeptide repeat protein [Tepidisphaeraceae bacterium]|jgi:predicted O-linked N-acetylglucosamine transferase (SPINDLY family)